MTHADRPFDLEHGPVMRAQLFERAGEKHVLLFTAHHIAMDFWSIDVLFHELDAIYKGGGPELYRDFLHFTPKGNDIVARELTAFLAPHLPIS